MTSRPNENLDATHLQESAAGAPPVVRPVRVLVIAASLDIIGGQAVQAVRLIDRLKNESSLEVEFLPINPPFPKSLRRYQSVKYVRSMRTTALYWLHLARRVRHADIVHVFSASYLSFIISPTPAILAAKFYNKKIVLHYHSGEAEDHLRRWRSAITIIRLADRIVTPSGYLVDVFARFGLRAEAIFNHIDLENFRFRQRHEVKPVFLTNRNFAPHYNVACVLRAFKLIQNRYPHARLMVAGDGSERARLKELARELDLSNIEFLGAVTPQRMAELYDAAEVYLNSPNIDNMPLSLLEAFASGVPVVTTDAGGIPYIATHNETALLVNCNDHEALAAAALRLLENGDLVSSLTTRAREECAKYSWAAVKPKWLALYHSLMHSETRAPDLHDARERQERLKTISINN